jgi:hypothetical protein
MSGEFDKFAARINENLDKTVSIVAESNQELPSI